jgi:hypothetical protein
MAVSEPPVPTRSRGLPPEAYERIAGEDYRPYIPAKEHVSELTLKSIFIGILLGIVFGAANAYLGLRVGPRSAHRARRR